MLYVIFPGICELPNRLYFYFSLSKCERNTHNQPTLIFTHTVIRHMIYNVKQTRGRARHDSLAGAFHATPETLSKTVSARISWQNKHELSN